MTDPIEQAAARHREAQAAADDARERLHELIREELSRGTRSVKELAALSGLSAPRIYQIRDRRR